MREKEASAPYYAGEGSVCTCVVKTTGYAGGFNLIREKERPVSFERTEIDFTFVVVPLAQNRQMDLFVKAFLT